MLDEGRGVTETCFACGFNNLSHFSRSFTRALRRSAVAHSLEHWQESASWARGGQLTTRACSGRQLTAGAARRARRSCPAAHALADPAEDIRTVAALDTAYQAAVERNDAEAMAAILHEDMILVLGDGTVYTREDLIELGAHEAHRSMSIRSRNRARKLVRLYGADTAIVTARL